MPNALFDLDGTLCNPLEGIAHGFRFAFAQLNRPYPGDGAVAGVIGKPLAQCFGMMDPGADGQAGARHFQSFFESRGFAEAHLYEGIGDCLRGLRGRGWGTAVASAKPTFAVEFVAESLALKGSMDGLFGCAPDDLNPHKGPIVGAALATLGWSAKDTFMIGDRSQDRDAALEHGLKFVAAAWGFGTAQEFEGAWAVAGSPGHLTEILLGIAGG